MVGPVSKKSLPTVGPREEGLGRPTIMDPALAAKHGIDYVHLVVFAIDMDRVCELVDADEASVWPFGWEVFLTEVHLLGSLDIENEAHRAIVEDTCISILEEGPSAEGDEPALGSQLLFAVYDAVARGEWPADLRRLFQEWERGPDDLVRELEPLWKDAETEARDIAEAVQEIEIDPPLSPTTEDALEALVEVM